MSYSVSPLIISIFFGKVKRFYYIFCFFFRVKKKTDGGCPSVFRNEFEKWLRVEEILEGLAEFKNGLLASRDFDFFFGLRIDTGLCGYVLDLEGAEAHQLYFVARFQSFGDGSPLVEFLNFHLSTLIISYSGAKVKRRKAKEAH